MEQKEVMATAPPGEPEHGALAMIAGAGTERLHERPAPAKAEAGGGSDGCPATVPDSDYYYG